MYKIIGTYHGKTEELDETETKDEAIELANEYRIAFGRDWTILVSLS